MSHSTLSAGEPSRPFRLGHVPALDGLRGVACLIVIFLHFGFPLRGGFLGVDIFFVLSGYLITCLLLQEWQQTGAIHLTHFFRRRVLRLLPAQLLVSTTCVAIAAVFLSHEIFREHVRWAICAFFAEFNRSDVVGQFTYVPCPLAHMWSLSIEDKFYLLWPLLLLAVLGQKNLSRGKMLGIMIGALIVCVVLRRRVYLVSLNYTYLFYDLISRADSLLVGCIAGAMSAWGFVPRSRWFSAVMKTAAIVFAVGIGLAVKYVDLHRHHEMLFTGGLTAFAIGVAAVILALVHSRIPVVSWVLERRFLAWTGCISYGLYLWHYPIVAYASHIAPQTFNSLWWRLSFVAGTYAIAVPSYYLYERRFLALKPKRAEAIDSDATSASTPPMPFPAPSEVLRRSA
jgi:peptidoglycan/LPS O-acetylase OafA/YrhL